MTSLRLRLMTLASALLFSGAALADQTDMMVVFDGSGSMWGQIEGRSKIEIARDTLSSVLSEVHAGTNIGMIAYGHRQKGQCSDIETVVPSGPAGQSVPAMIDVANRLQPKGKTPLADAVRIAAEELKYTENAATVILVTDGIETCNADPCAIAKELESLGVNFTAHVIGFGLSQEEGRQVQCLAENTGGLYLAAKNAKELSDALRRTVQQEPESPPQEAAPVERKVRFILRDTPDGKQIGIRQLSGIVETADGQPIPDGAFTFAYPEAHGNSATANLVPGSYVGLFQRADGKNGGYKVRYAFEVPEGDGEHVIEGSLAAALTINVFINPAMPYKKGEPFPTSIGGSRPRVTFEIFSVEGGQIAPEPVASAYMHNLTMPLSPGTYLVRGNLDNSTSAEHLVEVTSGGATEIDFSFDATRVYIEAREADGFPVKRQTTYWYAGLPDKVKYWIRGGGVSKGTATPFYVPTGSWVVNVGGEGYGKRRSVLLVDVPGDYQDIRLKVGEGKVLDEDDKGLLLSPHYKGCLELLKVKRTGCLVKRADLSMAAPQDKAEDATKANDKAAMGDDSAAPDQASDQASDMGNGAADLHNDPNAVSFRARATTRDSGRFELGPDGQPRMVLEDSWCGYQGCDAAMVPVPMAVLEAVRQGKTETFDVGAFRIFTAPGTFDDMVTIVKDPTGKKSTKAVMWLNPPAEDMTNTKTNTKTGADQAKTGGQPEDGSGMPEGLKGLVGTDYAFADLAGNVRLHVVFPKGAGDPTIVLDAGWCGSAQCAGDRFAVPMKRVDQLLNNGYSAASFGAQGYQFDVSTFGERKNILVSGAGASRVAFDFFDQIQIE